ncbi:MAG: MFS transporter [Actinomycetota bacterium]|nr:MFS transporter [Actinomycetota bacterium]
MRRRVGLGQEYTKLFAARTFSNLGDGMTLVAGPLLAASLTRDPLQIAGLAFAQRLPWLLFALPSGALVDRLDRRRLMAAVDAFRSAVVGLLGIAVLLDLASLPLLYGIFFLVGTAETLFDPASVSVLPAVVAREDLQRANGRLYAGQIVANNMAGPPLGGLLFSSAAALPFLLDAGTFAAAAALVLTLRGPFRARSTQAPGEGWPPTMRTEIAEGLYWLWRHRLLRALVFTIGVMNLTFGAAFAVWVLYAQERLGLGPVGYGALAAAIPVGGVLGGLVAERVTGLVGAGTFLRAGLLVEVATHFVLASTTSPRLAGTTLAIFGFHAIVWGTLSASLRQELVPEDLMGRVNSIYLLFDAGSASIGALLGGLIAGVFGLTAPFWLAAAFVAAWLALVWRALGNRAIEGARAQASHW